jgi:hypothetical protein
LEALLRVRNPEKPFVGFFLVCLFAVLGAFAANTSFSAVSQFTSD